MTLSVNEGRQLFLVDEHVVAIVDPESIAVFSVTNAARMLSTKLDESLCLVPTKQPNE
jgi:hypothetical protein